MIEALFAVALTVCGAGLLATWRNGVSPAAHAWVAFPLGAAAYIIVSLLMLVVFDRVAPFAALGLCTVGGAAGLAMAWRRGLLDGRWLPITAAMGVAFAVGVFVWLVPLARLTLDSGEYLLGASQMKASGAVELMSPYLLKRQMGLQALHALATSDVRAHVAWASPLFGVAGTGLVGWLAWSRLAGTVRWRVAVVVGIVALLVSSNRFFYDFFYVHPHVQMAVYLLLGVVGIWFALTGSRLVWAFVAGVSLATTLVMRPEAPLLVAIVLGAFAVTSAGRAARLLVAVPPMVVIVLWYGFVLWGGVPGGDVIGPTEPVFSSLLAVVGVGSAVLVLEPGRFDRARELLGKAIVPALIAVLLIYTISDFIILRDSLVATFRNLKRLGWWVATWAIVVPLAAAALLAARFRLAEMWSRVVMGFALLFFTFPYLRGSPWRVGPGDSGNRMLAHFLLVVVAFVILAFADDPDEAATPIV